MSDRENEWLRIRRMWIKLNPPNHEGQYLCSICGKPVSCTNFELDHVLGRDGDNFRDLDNLRPTHKYCNQRKGSQKWTPLISDEEYKLRKDMDL